MFFCKNKEIFVIVTFREDVTNTRHSHLKRFIYHITGQVPGSQILIIEQSKDKNKFNRGKLLNIGFELATSKSSSKSDIFIFHDVDLLPDLDLVASYATYPETPLHFARRWERYSKNPEYFGGVVAFCMEDFYKINGYPNSYWGWGGEDDELMRRYKEANLGPVPPNCPTHDGTYFDMEELNLETKLQFLRKNPYLKNFKKWEGAAEHDATWKTDGLRNLDYAILKKTYLGETILKVTVKL